MNTSPTDLSRARALTRALDSAVRIPGTAIRFGLDAVLGLIPGLGDAAGAALSGYLILLAVRSGAPAPVIARMTANVGIDLLTGIVPVLGDMVDVAWKANTKNLQLLERHIQRPLETRRASKALLVAVAVALVAMAVGAVTVAVLIVRALSN